MAGTAAYYFIGQGGGFMGSDGMAGYELMVEVGAGSREWLSLYDRKSYNFPPMSMSVKTFVPKGPEDMDKLRIALILWVSELFRDCPSYETVKAELQGVEFVDFDTGRGVPKHFYDLLEESRSVDISDRVNLYCAPLYDVGIDEPYPGRDW